jgi:hypothetical protein
VLRQRIDSSGIPLEATALKSECMGGSTLTKLEISLLVKPKQCVGFAGLSGSLVRPNGVVAVDLHW